MIFRTVTEIPDDGLKVGYGDGILMLGSCFTDSVGERLKQRLMEVCINPFGTLYNPASIAQAVERLVENRSFTADDLFEYKGMWHSFAHHSRFSSSDRGKALQMINAGYTEAVEALHKAKVLIATFGTAYVFKRGGAVVANCHKLPACEFERVMLGVDETVGIWSKTVELLAKFNPVMKIVFTVSPIRHLADGLHGNQLSKATLLLAVDALVKKYGQCSYFPSYEIMTDELRDYRFYAADMTHPSEVAVDYVMERFADAYFTADTCRKAEACLKPYRMANHRPLTDNAAEISRFRESMRAYACKLSEKLPCIADKIAVLLQ